MSNHTFHPKNFRIILGWVQIITNILLVLICVQTVCKGSIRCLVSTYRSNVCHLGKIRYLKAP